MFFESKWRQDLFAVFERKFGKVNAKMRVSAAESGTAVLRIPMDIAGNVKMEEQKLQGKIQFQHWKTIGT